MHLSKTRQTKFNESAQLLVFSAYSVAHAGYILYELSIYKDVTLLWSGYPEAHKYFNLSTKLFYLFQVKYFFVVIFYKYKFSYPIGDINFRSFIFKN